MKYRSDLAVECREMIEESGHAEDIDGIVTGNYSYYKDINVTRIDIVNKNGAAKMNKPEGTYITIEAGGVLEERDGIKESLADVVAAELKRLVPFDCRLRVLVAGLGNSMVTPDALGPAAAAKIKVTRHLFLMFEADSDEDMSCVSCIAPGVTGTTGMETAELVKKAAELTSPDLIIVIDSLAARRIERVSTTIQITDTGISPGGGMGNARTSINKDTVGTKVIAIGVPTVIDVSTIIRDVLDDNMNDAEQTDKYIEEYNNEMIVTSTDIDTVIKDFSDIIASGINKTLHPGIYS